MTQDQQLRHALDELRMKLQAAIQEERDAVSDFLAAVAVTAQGHGVQPHKHLTERMRRAGLATTELMARFAELTKNQPS